MISGWLAERRRGEEREGGEAEVLNDFYSLQHSCLCFKNIAKETSHQIECTEWLTYKFTVNPL